MITILIIIILIILFGMYTSWCTSNNSQNILTGFWEADSGFCVESGLDSFHLYIDAYDGSSRRGCYILAQQGGDALIEEPTTCTIIPQSSLSLDNSVTKHYTIEFDIDNKYFPSRQSIRIYPLCYKMVLTSGDTITGVFYKNLAATETNFIRSEQKSNSVVDDADTEEL